MPRKKYNRKCNRCRDDFETVEQFYFTCPECKKKDHIAEEQYIASYTSEVPPQEYDYEKEQYIFPGE